MNCMKIWLDSDDLSLISKGFHDGVVTNPKNLKEAHIKQLLEIQTGPVIVDVYSDFLEKGSQIAALSPRIILRIPATQESWSAIQTLSKDQIPVMVGAIFLPVHALLAARTGAAFASPHLSRMLKSGDRPFEQIDSIQKIVTNYKFSTQIMALHPKSLEQVRACAEIGLSGIILRDDLFKELFETHELSSFHVEQSLPDWNPNFF